MGILAQGQWWPQRLHIYGGGQDGQKSIATGRSPIFCIALPAALKAHPHVYIDVDMHIETAPDGGLKQIHYIWTFDDLYSAFAVQGLRREQGHLSREALAKVAEDMIVAHSLKSGPA